MAQLPSCFLKITRRAVLTAALSLPLVGLALADGRDGELKVTDLPERPAATGPATPKLAYGLLVQHGDRLIFAPCRDRSYTLVDDDSAGGRLGQLFAELGLGQGKRLYVELIGVVENGRLRASDFNMLRLEGRCQMPGGQEESWRASGNDPAWALLLGETQAQIQRLGQPELVTPFAGLEGEGDERRYAARSEAGRLSLQLNKAICRDAPAQAVFAWTARVELNGEVLQGCAWRR